MFDSELLLSVLDRGLEVLLDFTSSHHACNRFESAAACRPRKPYILFLAHRHEFLDQHFYVEASKKRQAVMDDIRVVVCTFSRLQKLMSNPHCWWSFFSDKGSFSNKQKFLALDEDECINPLELATMIGNVDVVISGGDDTQCPEAHLRASRSSCGPRGLVHTISSPGNYVSPLKWESVSAWAIQADSQCEDNFVVRHGLEQHRYGESCSSVVRSVFPDSLGGLTCHPTTPDTLVVPCIFQCLYDFWKFGDYVPEVQRCCCIFSVSLCLIAVEMVLAVSRPQHRSRCWILVLASRYSVLQNLEFLVRRYCASIAIHVHTIFGIQAPSDPEVVYDASAWIQNQRIQFKVKQDAHGSNGEVTMNLITGRQTSDWSWAGDEINPAFLLEGLTRALLRQHVLIEDLSCYVGAKGNLNSSFLRQSDKLLLLVKCLDQSLCRGDSSSHSFPRLGPYDFYNIPFFFLKKVADQLAAESPCGRKLSQSLSASAAWYHVMSLVDMCRNAYDAISDWPAERHQRGNSTSLLSESQEVPRNDLFPSSSATSVNSTDHVSNWASLLCNLKIDEPSDPDLPEWPEYRAALLAGSFLDTSMIASVDVHRIRPTLVPTVGIHLQHLHTKQQEGCQYSDTATHSCNVTIALAPFLSDTCVDVDAVAILVASEALNLFKATSAYASFEESNNFSVDIGRHKKKEVEVGNARFVVSACCADRQAVIWKSGRRELLHLYLAMGLERQHPYQRTLLARCRSFTVADCVARAAMSLFGVERLSINPTCSDLEERAELVAVWQHHSLLRHNVTSRVQQYLQRENQTTVFVAAFSEDFSGFRSFLAELDDGEEWKALCRQVLTDISAISPAGSGASGDHSHF